jgi:GntR family transcriptional repressor for pyruvate dehydrogenase complex
MENNTIFRTIGTKERLVDRVVEEIQHLIIDHKLEPGMKLPPERDFAEQIGVSRTVIREAVKILVTKGMLQVRHGVGTVVNKIGGDQISEPLTMLFKTKGITLANLHQVRTILEVEIAGVAAENATPQEVKHLEENLAELEKNMNDPEAFAAGDTAFHHTIAEFSHNPLLVMLLDSIGGLMHEVRTNISRYPAIFKTVLPDHREILKSIQTKDTKRARQAMRHHLENARKIQQLYLKDQRLDEKQA